MTNTLIQWNCRGLKANFNEILRLLTDFTPSVLCLQETLLKQSDNISIKNYTVFNYIFNNNDRAAGGSSVVVSNRVPHSQVNLNTPLQAVAVRVTLHKTITVCSVYLPPNKAIQYNDLDSLIKQLPEPFILLGDLNGHNPLWGCSDLNNRGKCIEDCIIKNDLCLFNDKSLTYIHPATGNMSSLDLSICSPSLYLDYLFHVHDDSCGSDHFPTFLTNDQSSISEPISRWKFSKANWKLFASLCDGRFTPGEFVNVDDPINKFSSMLLDIAEECIPKTSTSLKRNNPWFNEDCKKSTRERRAAIRRFQINPTSENLESMKIFRAKARRTVRQAKKKSWQSYVSKLNSRSSVKKVWDMVRKISGKNKSSTINHLKKSNSDTITDKKDIADCLANTFSKHSSSDNYTNQFQKFKCQQEKTKLNFTSNNEEKYNMHFSLEELRESLNQSHDTACGPDQIHYQFLKHLPDTSLLILLSIFNGIWDTGELPPSWKEATVIPIPKPNKDNTNPAHYRPIALTSCVCKTLERMINTRLVWFLESNQLITNFQSGFRKRRSTNDHLVRLESFIRDAFIKKEHLVAVFFDLEKAYDTTWKYGIMKDLADFGLKGRLPSFISNFLSDRNFRVRIGSTLSDTQQQEEGVPQGSILSVTLFGIKINNIVKCLNQGVDCSLYVDDFLICYRSKNMHTIERQLQQCLNKLDTWSNENGFKFSTTKTQCVHFCQRKKRHDDPVLMLNNSQIPVVDQAKFLGVIFDKKLSFVPHIKALRTKCLKALNLLKVLAHTDWGADRKVLLRLYRSLIRSKLDYGSIVYGSARKSYLQMLDTIHHQGLRLAIGAFRTSPVESILAEANEPSLYLRREKLSLNFICQVKSNPNNPANSSIEPKYEELYERKPRAIRPIGLRMKTSIEGSGLLLDSIKQHTVTETPPWTIKTPNVLFKLCDDKKSETSSIEYQSKFSELKSQYPDYIPIYTDGSKDGDKVGCASVSHLHTYKMRLPDKSSIFSAEVKAIDLAFRFIASLDSKNFIIFSDSLSVLQSLKNKRLTNPLIQNLLLKHDLLSTAKDIIFCWLPSHVGISGNEEVDKAAKLSLNLQESKIKLPSTDLKPLINQFIYSKWQTSWNNTLHNKLYSIKPSLGDSPLAYRAVRREEVVLARCRIGHTRLTHSYLLNREEQPECVFCVEPLTVKHLLLDCVDLALARQQYFSVNTMNQLFNTVPHSDIISFLKETSLYFKF